MQCTVSIKNIVITCLLVDMLLALTLALAGNRLVSGSIPMLMHGNIVARAFTTVIAMIVVAQGLIAAVLFIRHYKKAIAILALLIIVVASISGYSEIQGQRVGAQVTPISVPTVTMTALAVTPARISSDEHDCRFGEIFSAEAMYWQQEVCTTARQFGLEPNEVMTVLQIEACGNPEALSGAGAVGIMQVVPKYHMQPGDDLYDPETSLLRGGSYYMYCRDRGGPAHAFACYNGGPSRLDYLGPWPADYDTAIASDEWLRYSYWATGILAEAEAGVTIVSQQDTVMSQWLGRGGAALCSQARAWQQANPR